jgi:chromosome segregation ATPase
MSMHTQPTSEPAEAGGERPLTNPRLSANLRGDYEALLNDVEQARMLASDFQQQLAGKSNEVAHLKQIFEKTARDLAHLQEGITALREERHRLANEAMRAIALEHRLAKTEAENQRLRTEVEKAANREHARESQIAALTTEVERLRRQLEATPAAPVAQPAPRVEAAEARALLAAATDSLERLREIVKEQGSIPPVRPAPSRPAAREEFIDISFER